MRSRPQMYKESRILQVIDIKPWSTNAWRRHHTIGNNIPCSEIQQSCPSAHFPAATTAPFRRFFRLVISQLHNQKLGSLPPNDRLQVPDGIRDATLSLHKDICCPFNKDADLLFYYVLSFCKYQFIRPIALFMSRFTLLSFLAECTKDHTDTLDEVQPK